VKLDHGEAEKNFSYQIIDLSGFRVGDGGQEADFGMARVQSGVLDDNGNVRFEHGGIFRVARNRRRLLLVVESQMPGSAGRHRHTIRPGWLAVGEENRDGDVRFLIAGIENACRLVGNERMIGE
jgi:hypothetical protein